MSGERAAPFDSPPFDSEHFRHVFGHLPTGVAVIATPSADGPVGMTVGTLSSISLDPPLVGFMPHRRSTVLSRIGDGDGLFCASVLSAGQEAEARRMAGGRENSSKVEWTTSPNGLPVVVGCVAWIEARVETSYEAGDHHLVVARVLDLAADDAAHPLVFYKGEFRAISGL